jgi:hypothetical protein
MGSPALYAHDRKEFEVITGVDVTRLVCGDDYGSPRVVVGNSRVAGNRRVWTITLYMPDVPIESFVTFYAEFIAEGLPEGRAEITLPVYPQAAG